MPTIDLQAQVNQILCGDSPWAPFAPGYVIVGFEVQRKVWEGDPDLDGWDNIRSVEVVARFANAHDAEVHEKILREQRVPHRSYETVPIQVRIPNTETNKKKET